MEHFPNGKSEENPEYAADYLEQLEAQREIIKDSRELIKKLAEGWASQNNSDLLPKAHLTAIAREKKRIEQAEAEIQRILDENADKLNPIKKAA